MRREGLLFLSVGILFTANAPAQTTRLVPSPKYPTIQSAVDASSKGDLVLVTPGTYRENLDFKGKEITLRSLAGPAVTVIDGRGRGPCVLFARGETRNSVLEGFTLRNGRSVTFAGGGGVTITSSSSRISSPTIRNCVIRRNYGRAYGGGIGGNSGSPLVENCVIEENKVLGTGYASGGGIGFMGSLKAKPVIRRCLIRENEAMTRGGGCYFAYNNSAMIEDCWITGNRTRGSTGNLDGGAGIFAALNAVCVIRNCFIYGNYSASNGGGVKFFNVSGVLLVNDTIAGNTGGAVAGFANGGAHGANVHAVVVNCILWNNGPKVFAFTGKDRNGASPYVKVSYSDVQGGYTGKGNFSSDPKFVNPGSGNLRILPLSPCFNKGDNGAPGLPARDIDGGPRVAAGTVDVGADEFDPQGILLYSDRAVLSLAQGGKVTWRILGHGGLKGNVFVLLPSFGGFLPGTRLGSLLLPLNLDRSTWILLGAMGSGLAGTLDAQGGGTAQAVFPAGLPPALKGFELSSAAVVIDPKSLAWAGVSNGEVLLLQ